MSVAFTIVAIFLSDVRLAVSPKSADDVFGILAAICLFQFSTELVRKPASALSYIELVKLCLPSTANAEQEVVNTMYATGVNCVTDQLSNCKATNMDTFLN